MADLYRRALSSRLGFSCAVALVGLACDGVDSGPGPLPSDPSSAPAELSLLPAGNHVGMISGFNGVLPLVTGLEVESRWHEAIERGLAVSRLQIDWSDLESAAGAYSLGEFRERLSALSRAGVAPALTIGIGLDDGFENMPRDLRLRVASGELAFNSDEVTSRFTALLDEVIPIFVEHRGWLVSIGNEPGNTLDDRDDPLALAGQIRDFIAVAKARVQSIEPRLAVTVTLREDLTLAADRPFLPILLEVVDVAAFNFYCSRFATELLVERDPAAIDGYIDRMLAAAGARPLVLMEFGCQGGYSDRASPTAASLALQSQFYQRVFDRVASEPRFRAAIAFQLVDWSPTLVEREYSELFRREGLSEEFIERFAESLKTIGLIEFTQGAPRPVWNEFLERL